MKKLIGIFNTKDMPPEQIFERAKKVLQENERLELLKMAKARGKSKNEAKTSA